MAVRLAARVSQPHVNPCGYTAGIGRSGRSPAAIRPRSMLRIDRPREIALRIVETESSDGCVAGGKDIKTTRPIFQARLVRTQ